MSYEPEFRPKLRMVDVFPFDWQGQKSLLLRDPHGYAEGQLVVPAVLGPLLARMDGDHTLRDLQLEASRLFGRLVLLEEIEGLVRSLDQHYFLEGERFNTLKRQKEEEFLSSPVRPPSHAGKAYPSERKELVRFLEAILAQGPGRKRHCPRVLIAPHIDLTVGAKGFAMAYQGLDLPPGVRVVVLGTGHFLESFFSLLDKDFDTPLGRVPYDREFVKELFEMVGPELRGHLWAHRAEHAIEFQVIFLRHLLSDFTLVPILCASPELFLPQEQDLLERLVSALRELADERTYFVLGVDFCHLGVRYGDPVPAGEKEKERALAYDRQLLEKIMALDAEGFRELIISHGNRYKVCGFGPLYVLLRVLEKKGWRGEILHQEAVDFGPGSIVSFAAAALYD